MGATRLPTSSPELPSERLGNTLIITLPDGISLGQLAGLRRTLWDAVNQEGIKKLIVDLRAMHRLDPSTLSLFISTQSMAAKCHAQLVLCGLCSEGYTFIEQHHLEHYFTLCEGLDTALAEDAAP